MLEAGQCVVLDFGARSYGYCSDMTRTVFLGEPDPEMRAAWDALREANESVEAMLRPGVTGKEGHEQAEAVLAAAGFGGRMGHGLGHGVGIDIHEEPVLAPRNERPLVARQRRHRGAGHLPAGQVRHAPGGFRRRDRRRLRRVHQLHPRPRGHLGLRLVAVASPSFAARRW